MYFQGLIYQFITHIIFILVGLVYHCTNYFTTFDHDKEYDWNYYTTDLLDTLCTISRSNSVCKPPEDSIWLILVGIPIHLLYVCYQFFTLLVAQIFPLELAIIASTAARTVDRFTRARLRPGSSYHDHLQVMEMVHQLRRLITIITQDNSFEITQQLVFGLLSAVQMYAPLSDYGEKLELSTYLHLGFNVAVFLTTLSLFAGVNTKVSTGCIIFGYIVFIRT